MSKNLKRIAAALVASLGIFVFAGCNTAGNGDESSGGGNIAGQPDGDGSDGETENPGTGGGDNTSGGDGKPDQGGSKPVVPPVPEGSVKISKAAGDLEAAYVEWEKVEGASGYNVYVKADGGYKKLDAPLVREYKDYFRADAVGLKAGEYSFKVVPTGGAQNTEDESKSALAENITVLPHDRSGYAFVNGTSLGAYNEDGALLPDANVLYVTNENKYTVSLKVAGVDCVGLQEILTAYKKETKPLSVRMIGNVGVLDTGKSDAGNFLIKESKAGITFEGIGSDATANGWGLRVVRSSNVEIRNIGFMNTVGDGIDNVGIENNNDHIWVHNCDMFYGGAGGDSDQAKGDGALDTKLSTYVTHSYNHFWDSGKCNLQGMKGEKEENYITYHHNWYDHSDSRHPRIRTCTTHIYNNYFDGNAKYGVGVTYGASAFVENNYFRSTANMKPMLSSMQGTDAKGQGTFSGENGGIIKAFGNVFDGKYSLITQNDTADKTDIDCYEATSRGEKVSADYKTKQGGTVYNNFDTAADFYKYEADSPEAAKEKVMKYAGRIGGGDFKWEFDNAKEDSNYAIIPGLKSALQSYKSGLVKVGGTEVSGDVGNGSGSGSGGEGDGTTGGGSVSGDVKRVDLISSNAGNYPAGIVVNGNYNSKTGYLKMESATKITVSVAEQTKVTVHSSVASAKIKINGAKVALDGNGEYSCIVKAGETLTIEKGDQMDLQYILFG